MNTKCWSLPLLLCGLSLIPLCSRGNEALAQQKACMGCHQVEKKVVGPAFKDIAARYAKDPAAPERLVQKVMKGSKDAWGPVGMPANPRVSEAEARELVRWVLSR